MIDSIPHLRQHVFISYARPDKDLVSKFVQKLRREGIPIWVDEQDIEPGTPNWEDMIRRAVSDSYAIVLACSPNIVQSQYVKAEIQLAEKNERQIIPVWIRGQTWVDSVPLSLVGYQHIDCRGDSLQLGTKSLCDYLRNLIGQSLPKLFTTGDKFKCPPGFFPIFLPAEGNSLDLNTAGLYGDIDLHRHSEDKVPKGLELVLANYNAFSSFEELLHDLYSQCLRSRYNPYTYGQEWVLVKASWCFVSLLALPWEWLFDKTKQLLIDKIPGYARRSTPLTQYGFGFQGRWGWGGPGKWFVVDKDFECTCGLFTSNNNVAELAFDSITKPLLFALRRGEQSTRSNKINSNLEDGFYSLSQVNPDAYKYKLVIAIRHFPFRRDEGLPENPVFVVNESQPF